MKPQDILKLVSKQLTGLSKRSESATAFREKQQEALKGIENTAGMQEIKEYWYREYDEACIGLSQVDAKDYSKVAKFQAQMNNARNFLNFLDNVLE